MSLGSLAHLKQRVFFGWRMVGLAGIAHSINATAYNKGFAVFLLPVARGLDVPLAHITWIFALSRSEGGPISPIAGWLIDRFGPKPIFFIGALLSGTGFLLLSGTQNVWTFGLVYLALITLGSDLAFSNSLSALVNNWFIRRRALAMSSYHAASSLGPAALVPLLALVILSQGWRTASMVCGLIILAITFPLGFLIRNTPESIGLLPDGEVRAPPAGRTPDRVNPPGRDPHDFSPGEALRTSSYWLLLAGSILRLTAKGGVMLNIIPILVWKGVEEQTAAFIYGFLLFLQVPLSLLFGWMADILPKNWILCSTSVAGTASFYLLAVSNDSIWPIYLFVLLFAVAETSGSNNWATFGDYFGRRAYGRLRGITQLAASPGVFLAPYLANLWFDSKETYSLPLWIFTGFFAMGALFFAIMRKPKIRVAEEAPVSSPI